MFDANDPSTGELVLAHDASGVISYRCPDCDGLVRLRLHYGKQPHFAHEIGEASRDCIRYTQERLATPFRSQVAVANSVGTPYRVGDLYFGFSPRGPEFSVELPALVGVAMSGTVAIVAEQMHRSVNLADLKDGFTVVVPLRKAPFRVIPRLDVLPEYAPLLKTRRFEVDEQVTLFFAEVPGPGRRVRPSERIRSGSALWAVSKGPSPLGKRVPEQVRCEPVGAYGVWEVLSILLPDTSEANELDELSAWLGYRVIATPMRVWIEHPLPVSRSQSGRWIHCSYDGPIDVRATGRGLLQLCDRSTGMPFHSEFGESLLWSSPAAGEWCIKCGGEVLLEFDVADSAPPRPELVGVQIGDSAPTSLYAAASEVALRAPPARTTSLTVSITVQCGALSAVIRVNGRTYPELRETGRHTWRADQSFVLDAGNFGSFEWHSEESYTRQPTQRAVLDLAQWLQSVALPPGTLRGIGAPALLNRGGRHPALGRLVGRRWDFTYQPQLNVLAQMIRRAQ